MSETIAAVLERLAGRPDFFGSLQSLLSSAGRRQELLDHMEDVTRSESPYFGARVIENTRFFAKLLERQGEMLSSAEQLDAVQILDREMPSILAAATRALSQQSSDFLLVFAKWLARCLEVSGRWKEALPLYVRMIDDARAKHESEYLLQALLGYSQLLVSLGRYKVAQASLIEARNLAHDAYKQYEESLAIHLLAGAALFLGSREQAINLYQEALAIRRLIGCPSLIGSSLRNLGTAYLEGGNTDQAAALYEESLAIYRNAGDRQGLSVTLNQLGNLAWFQQQYREAKRWYRECMSIARDLGDLHSCAMAAANLAYLAYLEYDLSLAESLAQESLQLYRRIDDTQDIGIILGHLAAIAICQEKLDQAKELLHESIACLSATGDQTTIDVSRADLAFVYTIEKDFNAAKSLLEKSLENQKAFCTPNDVVRASIIASGNLLICLDLLEQASILIYGTEHLAGQLGKTLQPKSAKIVRDCLAKVERELPDKSTALLKAQSESMNIDDLTDYALKALSELQQELGAEEEDREVADGPPAGEPAADPAASAAAK